MTQDRFRLREVQIEGFKGFTKSQTIRIDGKHLFVLGPNSYGKSSVIEATRWNLCGSTARPGEMVLNQWYSQGSTVETKLDVGGRLLTFTRTLGRGTGGKSDATLRDASGHELPIKETLPQLASLETGEGMHVVYSAQFAPLHRAPENLKPFARTLYSYLGLSEIPALLECFKDVLRSQQEVESRLAKELTELRISIETQSADVEDQVARFLQNAPWGTERVPPPAETRDRVRRFVEELVELLPNHSPPESAQGTEALLSGAQSLVAELTQTKLSEIDKERKKAAATLQARQDLAKRLSDIIKEIEDNSRAISKAESDRQSALEGESIDSLSAKVTSARKSSTESALTLEVQTKGLEWSKDRDAAGVEDRCPLCGSTVTTKDLVDRLTIELNNASRADRQNLQARESLENRLQQVELLGGTLKSLESTKAELNDRLKSVEGEVEHLFATPPKIDDLPEAVERIVEKRRAALIELDSRLADVTGSNQVLQGRLTALSEEARFHRIQDQKRALKSQLEQANRAQEVLSELAKFGESIRSIQAALEGALTEQLKKSLPTLNDKLSKAFQALTHHPVFDRILIRQDNLLELQLCVASSEEPGHEFPPEVLNGQALSALELVPYFAFSELGDSPIAVHLLLLDDPTQAFDPEHIESLIGELATLGKTVQLVVATHETKKVEDFVSKSFDPGSFAIMRFTSYNRLQGPTFTDVSS